MAFTADEVYALLNKKIKNSGGGGVTSWNDLTDKPFDKEFIDGYDEILESNYYIPSDGSIKLRTFEMIPNETYGVRWNGTLYKCVAKDVSDLLGESIPIFCIGNLGAITGGEDTGEPFIIICGKMEGIDTSMAMPLDGSELVKLDISGPDYYYKTLDDRYVPDNTVVIKLRKVNNDDDFYYSVETFSQIYNLVMNANKTVVLSYEGNGLKEHYNFQSATLDDLQFSSFYAQYDLVRFRTMQLVKPDGDAQNYWTPTEVSLRYTSTGITWNNK